MVRFLKGILAGCAMVLCFESFVLAVPITDDQVKELQALSEESSYPIFHPQLDSQYLHSANQKDFDFLKKNLMVLKEYQEKCMTHSYNEETQEGVFVWRVKEDCSACGKAIRHLDRRRQKISRKPLRYSAPVWDNSVGKDWEEAGKKIEETGRKIEGELSVGPTAARWDTTTGETWRIAGESIESAGREIFRQTLISGFVLGIEDNIKAAAKAATAANGLPVRDFLNQAPGSCKQLISQFEGENIGVQPLGMESEGACQLEISGNMRINSASSGGDTPTETEELAFSTAKCFVEVPCEDLQIGYILVPKKELDSE